MEYIHGKTLEDADLLHENYDEITNRIASIVSHLHSIQVNTKIPGPVGCGTPYDYIWGEDGAKMNFSSIEQLNDYLNKRLKILNKSIDLSVYPLVLCHMDLGRRNIILTPDDSIRLVDWAYAGLYPRFFEMAALPYLYHDNSAYRRSLVGTIKGEMRLTAEEEKHTDLIRRAAAASLRWVL